jgi:tetratricopeptide (TPR) repeat protein
MFKSFVRIAAASAMVLTGAFLFSGEPGPAPTGEGTSKPQTAPKVKAGPLLTLKRPRPAETAAGTAAGTGTSTAPAVLTPEEIRAYVKNLGSAKWGERAGAERKLLAMGEEALPLLAEALSDKDPEVRSRAETIMQKIKWKADPELDRRCGGLIERYGGAQSYEKIDIINNIYNTAGKDSRKFLERVAAYEQEWSVRKRALEMLARMEGVNFKDYLETLASAKKDKPWLYVILGEMARESGKLSAAVEYYNKAIALGERSWQIRYALAGLYRDASEHDKAIAVLKELADETDAAMDGQTVLMELASLQLKKKRMAEAMAAFRKALDAKPTAEIYSRMTSILRAGNFDNEAAALCREAIEKYPEETGFYASLAEIYERAGEEEKVLELYEKLLKITGASSSEGQSLIYRIGEAYLKRGWTDKAFEVWEKLVSKNPQRSDFVTLGRIYHRHGFVDRAMKVYSEGLKKFPGDSGLGGGVATIFISLRDFEGLREFISDEKLSMSYKDSMSRALQRYLGGSAGDVSSARKNYESAPWDEAKAQEYYSALLAEDRRVEALAFLLKCANRFVDSRWVKTGLVDEFAAREKYAAARQILAGEKPRKESSTERRIYKSSRSGQFRDPSSESAGGNDGRTDRDPEMMLRLSLLYEAEGLKDNADAIITDLENTPALVDMVREKLVKIHTERGQYERASALLKGDIEEGNADFDALYMYGGVLEAQGGIENAVYVYLNAWLAADYDYQNDRIRNRLGYLVNLPKIADRVLGRLALEGMKAVLLSDRIYALRKTALLARAAGRLDTAVATLEAVEGIDPDSAVEYALDRVRCLLEMKKYPEAARNLDKLISLARDDARPAFMMWRLSVLRGDDPKKSEEVLQKAFDAVKPLNEAALEKTAMYFNIAADYPVAVQIWRKIADFPSDIVSADANAYEYSAKYADEVGDYFTSEYYYRSMLILHHSFGYSYIGEGWIEAINARFEYAKARNRESAGDAAGALAGYNRALKQYIHADVLFARLELLRRMKNESELKAAADEAAKYFDGEIKIRPLDPAPYGHKARVQKDFLKDEAAAELTMKQLSDARGKYK